ncbi:MAG: hypothetical protein O7H41_19120 [Planctomycetota bacterium]|nr:hypothetical protein [Planctomycetota bacterium]
MKTLAFAFLLTLPFLPASQDREAEDRAQMERSIDGIKEIRVRMGAETPHEILRGIFAFGKEFRVYEAEGDTFLPAVGYLLEEAEYKGKRIFREKKGDVFVISAGRERGQVQDLPDEILMVLALAGVGLDEKIVISKNKEVTVKDLLETAKKRVNPSRELSCTIVALAKYLPWGEEWDIPRASRKLTVERLLKASLQKNPAAYLDDGAHHLFALSYVLRKAGEEGGLPPALEKLVKSRLSQRRNRLKSQQSADGGLGFLGVRSLETSALHLNWVLISGPWEEVHQPWVDRAFRRMSLDVAKEIKRRKASYGTLTLAARALLRYSGLRYSQPG